MKRNVSLEEISDGKLYDINDMARVGCGDCAGCSDCCRGMGRSVVLDPLDIHRLTQALDMSFEELLAAYIELNVVDGVILPNLRMSGQEERCPFLSDMGRCTVHVHRPGICRLFPLGRYYENGGFRYFLQTKECRKENRAKVKISKWIDTPELKKNQRFIREWHYFLIYLEELLETQPEESFARNLNMYVLNTFFRKPYEGTSCFYDQFADRLREADTLLERPGD